jgi:hypothetical protein
MATERRRGRVVEGDGLENRYTLKRYRGFESLRLRSVAHHPLQLHTERWPSGPRQRFAKPWRLISASWVQIPSSPPEHKTSPSVGFYVLMVDVVGFEWWKTKTPYDYCRGYWLSYLGCRRHVHSPPLTMNSPPNFCMYILQKLQAESKRLLSSTPLGE